MTTFIQLHYLTAYPPSNLNRDDLGRPKTAIVGGTTRLRISSQSIKRAWRTSSVFKERLEGNLGIRTKSLGVETFNKLISKGVADKRAREVAKMVAEHFGKLQKEEKDNKLQGLMSEQLFHFSQRELTTIESIIEQTASGVEFSKEDVVKILKNEGGAADIALFGRMLASKDTEEDYTVEAAAQVSHPFSVQRVSIEDDYFTAVDDLNGDGAGHIGVSEFSSGLFYGYVCINQDLLLENLRNDKPLARTTLAGLVEAIATVAPTGKQNSYASRAYCSYLCAERGSKQPRSLAVAYLSAISDSRSMLETGIESFEGTRAKIEAAFGPSVDATKVMNVQKGEGTLKDIISFVSEGIND